MTHYDKRLVEILDEKVRYPFGQRGNVLVCGSDEEIRMHILSLVRDNAVKQLSASHVSLFEVRAKVNRRILEFLDALADEYGFELRRCLTGFKYIGDIITSLSDAGEVDRFIFGFEESYGYLSGDHVRDKDAVNASMLICQMAQYYKLQGKNLVEAMHDLYEKYGYYHNKTVSLSYPGADGAAKMAGIMAALRAEAPVEIAGSKVEAVLDYKDGVNGLPKANVIEFDLEGGNKAIVRPSGTEPKIKLYIFAKGADAEAADALIAAIEESGRELLS